MVSLPPGLISSLETSPGFDQHAFEHAHKEDSPVAVRFNKKKKPQDTDLPIGEPVPWTDTGFYLSTRPSFTTDPLFHAGVYYVQEASSMFLEQVLKQTCNLEKPLAVLDLCGAPGGKSVLIQSMINDKSVLVSNEVIQQRVQVLQENITKTGAVNVIVTNNDPREYAKLKNIFHVIMVDAPCSGSGLFRKDPKAINEWSPENVAHCGLRQQRILTDILPALKPGGVLIYSTCSYSYTENETIADWIVNDNELSSIRIELKPGWNIVESKTAKNSYGYRFYPDKVKGEGFFISAFKKNNDDSRGARPGNKKFQNIPDKDFDVIKNYIDDRSLKAVKWKDDILVMPQQVTDMLGMLDGIYIKKAGVLIGTLIKDELIPSHELGLSTILNVGLPFIELSKVEALQYLRRQELKIETTLKGWVLVKYKNVPLGWIKVLANRVNNYYPKAWRILNK